MAGRTKTRTKSRRTREAPRALARVAQAGTSVGPVFKRVCILTGGGDAPGLNAVIRAFVKSCAHSGIEVYGSVDGFEGLIQPGRLVKLTPDTVRGILPRGGSILGCSTRANPFAYPTPGHAGEEDLADVSDKVLNRIRSHQIEAVVMVGGDGTMHHAQAFMQRGVNVIGVPKTIDNDLAATDFTFGFNTALHTATWAIDTLHATAESHARVIVVEVMGRYAGWIALCAGIAGGADAIVIPELPYDVERIVAKIKQRSAAGASFSIVVVGEGARPRDGAQSTLEKGRKGHLERLGGAGQVLADRLKGRISHDVRVTVLGHLQRGGSPSSFDRLLGTRFGVRAAVCCEQGRAGVMVALRGTAIVEVPIPQVLSAANLVPTQGEMLDTARRIGIELGA